jgi:hypothetical protein
MASGMQSLFQSGWVDVISPTRSSIASNRRRWSPDATAIVPNDLCKELPETPPRLNDDIDTGQGCSSVSF